MQKLFVIILILFIFQCNVKYQDKSTISTVKDNSKNISTEVKSTYTISLYWNELKNFMYGNETALDSQLKKYQITSWYTNTIKNIKYMEIKLNKRKQIITNWFKENLEEETKYVKTAVYLLSGADLYHIFLFYPYAETYIMIALEDTGEISDHYTEAELQYGILSTYNIINNLTQSGYLFSKTMMQFLYKNQHSRFSGILPIFLYFIAYFQYDIIDITSICLDERKQDCNFKGLKFRIIDFHQNPKTLYYFNKKLEPQDFNDNSILDNFLNKFTNKGLFLKAAVYLFHYEKYINANQYLTRIFQIIIQDDSGIPYRYIKMQNYHIKLFGNYIDPANLKHTITPFQNDLYLDYKNNAHVLPFEFGYTKVRKSNLSNLIVAYK